MNTTPAVRKIPLDQLVLSPTNVRKTPPSASEDAELKASIASRGLKQSLVVHPSAGDSDVHEIISGGRRLKALQVLAAEGVIPTDYKVPCLVEAADEALETSLMENTIRAAIHSADEFVAMGGLIDAGSNVEAVAARFGVPEQRVKQRLRLGKLALESLDACDGAVSLDIIMAFTLGGDHAAQLAVWRQVKEQHYPSANAVRPLLTESAVPLDSDLGAFVSFAIYEAAGSKVTRDLFSSENDGFLDDAALVHRLAIKKLVAKAELRPHWVWAKPGDLDYGFRRQFAGTALLAVFAELCKARVLPRYFKMRQYRRATGVERDRKCPRRSPLAPVPRRQGQSAQCRADPRPSRSCNPADVAVAGMRGLAP